MPIEIIPKKAPKLPLGLNILFYFSIVLVLVSFSGFFILNHLEKKSADNLQNLEEVLAKKKTPKETALEEEILKYQKKINNFSILINLHQSPLNSFSVLERTSHPKVQFTNFSLNSEEFEIVLSGKTESFQTLGQQVLIFKNENLIKDVNLSKLSIGKEGGAEFTLSLSLDPEIFK